MATLAGMGTGGSIGGTTGALIGTPPSSGVGRHGLVSCSHYRPTLNVLKSVPVRTATPEL